MNHNILIINREDLKSIITEYINEAILTQRSTNDNIQQNTDELGDMNWLYSIYPDSVPKATISHKSAMNKIPGKIKFGKRVLYNKSVVLKWLRDQSTVIKKQYTIKSRL